MVHAMVSKEVINVSTCDCQTNLNLDFVSISYLCSYSTVYDLYGKEQERLYLFRKLDLMDLGRTSFCVGHTYPNMYTSMLIKLLNKLKIIHCVLHKKRTVMKKHCIAYIIFNTCLNRNEETQSIDAVTNTSVTSVISTTYTVIRRSCRELTWWKHTTMLMESQSY